MKFLAPALFSLILVLFIQVNAVSAQSTTAQTLQQTGQAVQSQNQNQITQVAPNTKSQRPAAIDRSATIQTRAVNEIQRRITSLTNVLNKVNAFENLTSETKTVLTTQLQQEIDSLTALQTQIQSETDEAVIKEMAQTVVTNYRTYAVFLPKVRTILAGEGILMLSEKMIGIQEQLAMQVSELELEGVDTSAMEQTLIDVEESITEAQDSATEAIDLVTPLSPVDYPANKTVFQNARTLLRDARLSLVAARDSLGDLVDAIAQAQTAENAMTDAMEDDEMLTEEVTNESSSEPVNTFNVETTN